MREVLLDTGVVVTFGLAGVLVAFIVCASITERWRIDMDHPAVARLFHFAMVATGLLGCAVAVLTLTALTASA